MRVLERLDAVDDSRFRPRGFLDHLPVEEWKTRLWRPARVRWRATVAWETPKVRAIGRTPEPATAAWAIRAKRSKRCS
jgi:hypothetical protein